MNLSIIKEMAKVRKITLGKMCEDLGISYQTLRSNIKSNYIDIGRWKKIADYLGIDESIIFDRETNITSLVDKEKEALGIVNETKPDYHCGNMIKKRMEDIGMTQTELSHLLKTQKQNVFRLLKSKTIEIETLVQINDLLNPPGSPPWDIFSKFSREYEGIDEKYIKLLEKHLRFKEAFIRICAKYNIPYDETE